jgi:hypothetical protein
MFPRGFHHYLPPVRVHQPCSGCEAAGIVGEPQDVNLSCRAVRFAYLTCQHLAGGNRQSTTSTETFSPSRWAAARATVRKARIIRPCLPMILPMSS